MTAACRPRQRRAALTVSVAALLGGCAGASDGNVEVGSPGSGSNSTFASPDTSAPVAAGSGDSGSAAAVDGNPELVPCVGQLTVAQKAGQLLMVLVASPALAKPFVANGTVGGYGLIGAQTGSAAAEIAEVAAAAPLPVLASGDEEGGTVQRFRSVLGSLPSAQEMATDLTAGEAAAEFGEYGTKLADLGLNMNFGPSLDVGSGSGLGTRSFGNDMDTVSEYGLAVIGAVRSAGVIPVAKHWPGIGSGTVDPHDAESSVADLPALRERDMVPFDRAIEQGLGAIMVSHAVVPGLTDGLPASLSAAAMRNELRERAGFEGLIITDSLGMGAVAARYDNAEAAVASIAAGADIALLSLTSSVAEAHRGLVEAIEAGTIAATDMDRSVDRVLRAKGVTGDCPSGAER